jgi:putative ABC transport system substrate-binding protein
MKAIFLPLVFVALVADQFATAQPLQPPRVGVLMPRSPTDPGEKRDLNAFVQGFKDLGYIDGRNIVIEYQGADQKPNLLPQLAGELLRLRVSVIVAVGTTAIDAALKATKTIPIVMISGGDPVGRGVVKGYSVPGGNVTGLYSTTDGDEGKRVELLKEAFPWVSRVLVLNADRNRSRVASYLREGSVLAVGVEVVDVYSSEDLKQAFDKIMAMHPDGLITVRNVFTIRHAEEIANFALKNRLPSIHGGREFVEKGGLMSYGVNYTEQWRRSAFYVDKILKGASPAVLPLEPPRFEFLVNLRTANKMGYIIPPEILLEAHEVLK